MTTDAELLWGLGTLAAIMAAALLAHLLALRALFRFGWRTPTAQRLQERARWPARTATVVLAAVVALPAAGLPPALAAPVGHVLLLMLIAAAAWLAVQVVHVLEDTALTRVDVAARDNLRARRKKTQVLILRRVAVVTILILASAAALLTFEQARAVGASVLASAGIAGLLAGVAARSTLGNMVAGIQIAFSEPIRLDDVVVVEGEWGRIQEITLTYVVVRLWDNRRLVLPTTYFVEQPFQNWTRENAQVLGTVVLHVDHRTPVEDVRQELLRVLEASDKWDGQAWVLQVVDTTEHTMVLRALMSAEDAPTAWDLRCEVREQLIGFLQQSHPEALPRIRLQLRDGRGPSEPQPSPQAASRRATSDGQDAFGSGGPQDAFVRAGSQDTAASREPQDAFASPRSGDRLGSDEPHSS
ncbi:MAG TPA: mechanosensitive ion channel domain-containing protein [Nitriliruptorales bacterium]|nr:mechanosensitive ion channel domain-containing protein [Nitriliruptorales bacterium]